MKILVPILLVLACVSAPQNTLSDERERGILPPGRDGALIDVGNGIILIDDRGTGTAGADALIDTGNGVILIDKGGRDTSAPDAIIETGNGIYLIDSQ